MTNLAFQLFSARETDLSIALGVIANAGFSSVEAYSENFKNTNLFRQALKREGLELSSTHVGLEELETNLVKTMELVTSFGCTHIVCPYLLPENRPSSHAGWSALSERLNRINDNLTTNGFSFAWHNHDFEFIATDDGSMPMQLLLDQVPNMNWELDIGWMVRIGADPSAWIERHQARISAFHFKDLALSGSNEHEDGWADVGLGVVPWDKLLNTIKKVKTDLYIVEHDKPSDLKRFAENSISTINSWNL